MPISRRFYFIRKHLHGYPFCLTLVQGMTWAPIKIWLITLNFDLLVIMTDKWTQWRQSLTWMKWFLEIKSMGMAILLTPYHVFDAKATHHLQTAETKCSLNPWPFDDKQSHCKTVLSGGPLLTAIWSAPGPWASIIMSATSCPEITGEKMTENRNRTSFEFERTLIDQSKND